ncbi:hypothetical protein E9531_09240 [Lampropedia puyangensis]|uniref:NrtR DNA-binding winged helix domain-containing protein n=1 Tax=Lampropedia puyangensis TaxID=1330072 RepID=A0A4V4GRK2_9BURK|nr:hypothetical protein [Lampropedia puyangensis]THU01536.1 hypothetical protein E9531_09240 [Lampropedia puyangensis]
MSTYQTPFFSPAPAASHAVQAELVAVLAAVTDAQPRIMTTRHGQSLPAGPFTTTHRSLQMGMRAWVESETRHPIGYIEQLYTFADPGRLQMAGDQGQPPSARHISISYLGLTREQRSSQDSLNAAADQAGWRNWYDFFPWEDRRSEWANALLQTRIEPYLRQWIGAAQSDAARQLRRDRVTSHFGLDGQEWSEDAVLQRYELLFEAGLIAEGQRSDVCDADAVPPASPEALPGLSMWFDHRRILATGMARLRAKLKYRPVVFELMPEHFTLLQLQQTAEAITGRWMHKQNFRRLVEQQDLIEETGDMFASSAGRPAKVFRFRPGVTHERAIAGTKLPVASNPFT